MGQSMQGPAGRVGRNVVSWRRFRRLARFAGAGVGALVAWLAPTRAEAQQRTFHLDRLEMPGAPDDGNVLFRPVTNAKSIFFGQLGLGYSLNPLHTSNITSDRGTLGRSPTGVVQHQFTSYGTVGFQFLNRVTIGATLPITWIQSGENPSYTTGIFGGPSSTAVDTSGPSVSDMRLDLRVVIARTENKRGALGGQLSLFAPTGNGSNTNFGGDGQTTALMAVAGEYDFNIFILTANTGVHFRPVRAINNPVANNGLGVGNEWRWAVGGFIPLKAGKYRVGATIFGQTGIETDTSIVGDTFFTRRNTPIEWHVEGRMRFGPKDRWWAGLGGGSLINNGYGAPDLRVVALAGTYVPIFDSDPKSPDAKEALRQKWRSEHLSDRDGDGIPDDIDACPDEPEDHQGNDPNDGCPMPPDRDGDGIPDQYDKCPDEPEDKDGIDDDDGCPEDDADSDGVPDTEDACPKEPGQPSPNPKANGCPQFIKMEGSRVLILKQVHFQTGSAKILPDSFPMLKEIVALLNANKDIKLLRIEGHTDNVGGADMNLKLSKDRARSVREWLTSHGVDADRLASEGYGLTQPIADNSTAEGRAANRRVEFKIEKEKDR